ncbi:hypothetical protein SCLCIDRAFT_34092 [Scleroderma citrinum Foug A]|uniref:Uncharacterized protein n=1 Tax=Scleroderma citrinum Foug A TaxID=1036808 RepID=A0A0C2ZCD3_9AGAM|nr:hypothetical protein SCLCIDRAFT_34092 [Scleroderma citrinum Foug A]
MATELVDLIDRTPLNDSFPSSPISSTSSLSHSISAFEALGVQDRWDAPTMSSGQVQYLAPRRPTSGLVPGPHPFDPNDQINPNGPIGLYVPGELTLDGHAQRMYNGFLAIELVSPLDGWPPPLMSSGSVALRIAK